MKRPGTFVPWELSFPGNFRTLWGKSEERTSGAVISTLLMKAAESHFWNSLKSPRRAED